MMICGFPPFPETPKCWMLECWIPYNTVPGTVRS